VFTDAEQHSASTGWASDAALKGDGTELTIGAYTTRRSVLVRLSLADGRALGTVPAPERAELLGYGRDGWLLLDREPVGGTRVLRLDSTGATTVLCSIPAGYQYALRYGQPDSSR
jgi:hypothetical protein